ncbi:MAG: N-acetylneuraminate synthase family protein, partial [Deltaproteobacteria bacterium]|nr:N-acetylneuraminate synthase family protein [Deltaproteobacteria bacterium]
NITHIVALQPDHPDRNTDIDAAIEIVLKHRMLDFITTDRFGVRHGSVRIMDRDAMMKDQLYQSTGGAWIDNCINIHTEQDLRRAQASFLRKNRSMMIGQRQVCRSDPALIMVGITAGPDTDLDILKKIVDHAKDAGADGVIFRESPSSYFDKADLKMVFSYTSETGLIPLIPVSRENDDYFGELSNEAILFPPDKHYDAALLEKAASKNIPVILQIEKTSHETIRSFIDNVFETANRDIILLSCLCAENNVETYGSLKQISELIAAFPEAVVGLSGHAGEINESLAGAAIALGAGVIEIPYPRSSSSGAGVAKVSHIPENLERYINYIRITERALGIGVKYALQPKPDRSGHTDK